MADAEGRKVVGEVGAFVGGRGRETFTKPLTARIDPKELSRLGVDEPERTDVRELLLPGIPDLERDDVVVTRQLQERRAPVARAAEVGDDDDQAALPRERPGASQRLSSDVAPETVSSGSSRRAVSRPTRPIRPCLAGSDRGLPSPNVTIPRRFPRLVATWPIASAVPSATSAFRRSAVPNCIESEVFSTSHVTSTRSAS